MRSGAIARRIAATMSSLLLLGAFAAPSNGGDSEPQDPQEPQEKTAPWPRSGDYAGVDSCRDCHKDEASAIAHGVHAPVVASAMTMQCETCHGPGASHAGDPEGPRRKITHPQKLSPRSQAALCSRCHAPEAEHHGGGGMEGLLQAGFGCTDCHAVHERTPEAPMAGIRFRSRAATLAAAQAVKAAECSRCHPLQSQALAQSAHHELVEDEPKGGCATCHGNGSLHVDAFGVARLISRPDRASDGVATCIGCHADVDPRRAHWRDGPTSFLGTDLDCFACHRVHQVRDARTGSDAAPVAGEMKNAGCAKCHAPAFTDHIARGTVHRALAEPSLPAASGCAACHQGAVAHAAAGGRKDLVQSLRAAPRKVQEQICLACHRQEPALSGLHGGAHARNDVSCTSCHSPSPVRSELATDAERNCGNCHANVSAQFRLPNRHPVDADHRMHCSDCHEPHSARPRLRDLQLREAKCVECHRAYRGPFAYAHQASRIDGCVACHEPHGSSNKRMLHEVNTQQNCTACHGDFPSFHDQTQGSVFTDCLNCHTQVHGSNHSRYLLR